MLFATSEVKNVPKTLAGDAADEFVGWRGALCDCIGCNGLEVVR